MEHKCEYCQGVVVHRRSRDAAKRFCDRRCAALALKANPKIACICGKMFHPKAGRKRFCSNHCRGVGSRSTYRKLCPTCGEFFILKNRAYERRGAGIYCSQSCATRIYAANVHYFQHVDDERKAYWLGFFAGDGYQDGDGLIFHISKKDHDHLCVFKSDIQSEHPIKPSESGGDIVFGIYSRELCADLRNLGYFNDKTFTAIFPDIPNYLRRHFVRGLFDADGNVGAVRSNYGRWSIHSAAPALRNGVREELHANGIRTTNPPNAQKGRNVCISNIENLRRVYHYMYDGSTVFLERKKAKFTGFI